MRTELSQARIDELNAGADEAIAAGCVIGYSDGEQWTISHLTGYLDELNSDCEVITVHANNGNGVEVELDIENLRRGLFRGEIKPISPDWFIAEWQQGDPSEDTAAKAEAEERKHTRKMLADIKAKAEQREVEHWSDTELFAKVSGAPLALCEEMLVSYEGNLARMANSTPKQLQLIGKLTETRSVKVAAAFELGKRLARFHAERPKITSPSDVADLMMSKLRYLQKEIVVVLALDTKGGVSSTGKAGEIAGDVKWGKMLAESTVFEGTLNASVFHPREIFRFAIQESANSIVLCHNHPSGDPQPSQEDIRATKQLIEAGEQIGIKVLDHIVIGDGIFVSLKEEGFI